MERRTNTNTNASANNAGWPLSVSIHTPDAFDLSLVRALASPALRPHTMCWRKTMTSGQLPFGASRDSCRCRRPFTGQFGPVSSGRTNGRMDEWTFARRAKVKSWRLCGREYVRVSTRLAEAGRRGGRLMSENSNGAEQRSKRTNQQCLPLEAARGGGGGRG